MTRYVLILVAIVAVAGIVFAQDAPKEPPKEPPKSEEQREPVPDPALTARIDELTKQLGDDDFEKREAAQAELIKIGKPALASLEKAIKETDDPEVRNRAVAIVAELRLFTPIGKNEQGYEEYRHEMTGMIFVKVPGGTFKMGSDEGKDDEKPVHEVKLDGFLISKCEVTQAVWKKIMRSCPSHFQGDDNPVETMSWDDCQEFCKETGLRLPTEAEWEYACRAGTNTKYYWGDDPDGDYMWYGENSDQTTHPVGKKKPNGFGLCDMCGNVWEMCQDWYGEDYYRNSPHDSPKGPEAGQYRVLRGGSCLIKDVHCRLTIRSKAASIYDCVPSGFRCVVSADSLIRSNK